MISKDWVDKWTDWIENGTENGTKMPGPFDNRALKRSMLKLKHEIKDDDVKDFYFISKPLFFYFLVLFGGGPCIV